MFLAWDAPRYLIAFAVHMGCYGLLVLTIITLRWHLKRENDKKDGRTARQVDTGMAHAFDDLTDRENEDFRYVY